MTLEINDLLLTVGFSTTLTTAVTVLATWKIIMQVKDDLCKKFENMAIRLGIVELDEKRKNSIGTTDNT